MEIKILISILALVNFSLTESAEVTCDPDDSYCSSFTISPVTSPNEEIILLDKPSDYVDTYTYSINFDSNSTINYIPTNLFKYFTNLHTFSLNNTSLHEIVPDAFNYCSKLVSITITFNNFPNLPGKFASSCYSVTFLSLQENFIHSIDENAFEGLEKLKDLDLSNNKISCLPASVFQHNRGLQNIRFSFNQITGLHPNTFKDLTLLQMAYFDVNQINHISNFDLSYTGTASMMLGLNLYFFSNPIEAVDPEFLSTFFYTRQSSGMPNLLQLYLNVVYPNVTNCIFPDDSPVDPALSGFYNGWVDTHVALKYKTSCYSSWNENTMGANQASC